MEKERYLTDPLRDAIVDVINALRSEQSYLSKRVSDAQFAKDAAAFIECSGQPFSEGGDFVCGHCAANHIMRGIELQKIKESENENP